MTTPSIFPDFMTAIRHINFHLKMNGYVVETESWQAMKTPREFYEALNVSFSVQIPESELFWVHQIKPNIPWVDDHFKERIGGIPLNPGEQYKNWPFYKTNPSNDTSRGFDGKFSHTYMERIWPRHAGEYYECVTTSHEGIRFEYGDLNTMIENMRREPLSRQLFLPIWFPEDGVAVYNNQRVPCTLGYQFIRRGNKVHIIYFIRSCDFFRHFRDDIYLALKLGKYILETVQSLDPPKWKGVSLGTYTMHITSLHIFAKEVNLLNQVL